MGLFARLCRNTGLMIHGIVQPIREEQAKTQKRELKRTVEEEKVSPTTTLRRTTIEEIEVRTPRPNDTD
jgi:hypothetical protein